MTRRGPPGAPLPGHPQAAGTILQDGRGIAAETGGRLLPRSSMSAICGTGPTERSSTTLPAFSASTFSPSLVSYSTRTTPRPVDPAETDAEDPDAETLRTGEDSELQVCITIDGSVDNLHQIKVAVKTLGTPHDPNLRIIAAQHDGRRVGLERDELPSRITSLGIIIRGLEITGPVHCIGRRFSDRQGSGTPVGPPRQ